MEVNEQIEVEAEEVEAEEVEVEQETVDPVTPDPETEAEARKYGWRPKEEFDRDPEGWVDADRFLELPSTHKKMLKDELRETKSEMAQRLERLERSNKAAMERALEQQQQAHQRELQQVRAAQRKAVEEGDTERYDRLESYEQSLLDKAPQPVEMEPDTPQEDPVLADYKAKPEGQWLNDPIMRDFAARAIDLANGAAGNTTEQQIAYAEKKVRDYFPHKFEAPKPRRQKVDGGGLGGGKAAGASKLPPEALKAAKDFVAQGIFKSVDEYAKEYFEQEG